MISITRNFSFLTAAFAHGAYQSQGINQPDLRGASVKGQLRWWYDAIIIGCGKSSEDRIFGGLRNQKPDEKAGPEASRISVRIRCLSDSLKLLKTNILLHKPNPGERGPKNAISPGTRYEVSLVPRREGLSNQEQQDIERALAAWLFLGGVGQRSNRAAGSLWPDDSPDTADAYEKQTDGLLKGSKLRCAILPGEFGKDEEKLRFVAGDFIDGPTEMVERGSRKVEVTQSWWPFGSADPRIPSLLKLRAARLDGKLRLVAVWDGRYQSNDNLRRGILALIAKGKQIGQMLNSAFPKLYT